MHKKISVVIPTYRRPAYLFNCLEALNQQLLPAAQFEVIVVHDGPADWDEVRKIKNNNFRFELTFIQTNDKKGPAAARNIGWLKAKYELIAFTDDDCLPDVNWLKELTDAYHFEPLVAYSGKTIVPLPQNPNDFEYNMAGLENADFITANCACTKQALIKIGGFDERFGMAWREDTDLEFKLIKHKIPIWRNSAAIVVHPTKKAEWGISLKEQKKGFYDVLLFKKYPQLYRQKVQAQPLWNYYAIILLTALLVYSILNGNRFLGKVATFLLFLTVGSFFYKRIKHTHVSAGHVAEMLVTSALIPFVSIYWRIYGIIKFRKLLF